MRSCIGMWGYNFRVQENWYIGIFSFTTLASAENERVTKLQRTPAKVSAYLESHRLAKSQLMLLMVCTLPSIDCPHDLAVVPSESFLGYSHIRSFPSENNGPFRYPALAAMRTGMSGSAGRASGLCGCDQKPSRILFCDQDSFLAPKMPLWPDWGTARRSFSRRLPQITAQVRQILRSLLFQRASLARKSGSFLAAGNRTGNSPPQAMCRTPVPSPSHPASRTYRP